MDLGIEGRTALVSASTGGLGLATARALGVEGVNVVVCGRRQDVAEAEAARLPSALGMGVDLEDEGSVRRLLSAISERFGSVDILILNSGGPPPGAAEQLTAAELTAAFERVLVSAQRLVAQTLPSMRRKGWGRIIAFGSSGVVTPIAGLAASNVARAALASYLKTLAREVAAEGVTVNMLVPGRMATPRVEQLDQANAVSLGISIEEVQRRSQASIPAARYGRPEEFGHVAAFLSSELASYVTGSQVRIDGGMIPTW